MKRLLFALMLLFGLSTALQASELMIQSFTPKGEVKGRPVFSVTFTEAVVAKNQVGKTMTGTKIPLRIRPALEGIAVWAAPDRLEFRPKQNIPPATEYFVDFGPGGLKSHKGKILAGPQSFSFHSQPMELLKCEQVNYTNADEIILVLTFSAPVTPQRLSGFLTLLDQNHAQLRYRVEGNKPSTEIVVITDSAPHVNTLTIKLAPGLKPDSGSLGIEDAVESHLNVLRIVEVIDASASMNSPEEGSISIQLTTAVDINTVKGHISLSPDVPFTVRNSWRGFVISGKFAPRSRVSLTIKKGLGGSDGLQKDYKRDFIFPDLSPRLEFGSTGLFLTPSEEPRIALKAVNINEVSLSLHRVYNNNLPLILSYVESWDQGNLTQWSKELETQKFLFNGTINEETRRAINLTMFEEKPSGLYLIHAKSEDENTWANDMALVNISDMALSAKTYRQGIQLWASSISSSEPITEGKVSVYSAQNQLLIQGLTDKNGLLTLMTENPWTADQQPAIAVLEKDDDITFVLLNQDQLAVRGIDTNGAPWPDGSEALWILPRNIWQPGETLQAEMVLRNATGQPVKSMPFRWVLTSNGLDVASGVITPNELGTAHLTAELPAAMAAGPAQLRLQIPGKDIDVASRTLQIEEFRPPQIEVNFVNPPKILIAKDKTAIEFQSRYLFGAPASELDWQLSYSAQPLAWQSKAHSGYFFGARNTETLGRPRGELGQNSLSSEGTGSSQWNSDALSPSLATPMEIFLRLDVMEKGGRWTGKTLRLPWLPEEALIGVLPPKEWIKPRQESTIPVVVIDSEDKPLERTVTVVVSQVHDRWTMVTENGRNRMTWQEDIVEKDRQELKINGVGSFAFTPSDEGYWQIDFTAGNFTTSIRLSVWKDGQVTTLTGPENLTLSTNQKNFEAGEKATVSVKSPFAGTLFVATGSDRPLSLQRLKLDGTEGSFTVSTEGMEPNGWCIATVIRPESMETKPPYRAMGALPLVMNLERSKLSVTVTAPEKTEPGSVDLSFTVKDHQDKPVDGILTIALVDRGILGLSGADNEDPWTWFTRLRRSEGLLADIFDQLRPNEDRSTVLLHPAGDDMAEAARMKSANADLYSPVSAVDYKPTSLWFTELPVKNGEASLNTVIPEFTGSLRVEVLAYSPTGLGRETSRINVARPVMIQGTMPRYVAPGDVFEPHLQLFSSLEGDGSLTVVPGDGLTFVNGEKEHKTSVTFKGGKAEALLPALSVSDDSGTAQLEVQLTVGDHTASEKYSMANRPGSPRIIHSGGNKADGTVPIEFPGKWFPGTSSVSVTLAGSPVTDATRLLDLVGTWGTHVQWLIAQAWAARSLPLILNDPTLTNEDELALKSASTLFMLQALQNHDGSWSRWNNGVGDLWTTASVMHLMTALKRDGVAVESHTWRTGLRYLRDIMNEPLPDTELEKQLNLEGRAYSCFVLASAGEAPLGWMNWLGDQTKALSANGNALLASAWAASGNRERATTLLGGDMAPKEPSKGDHGWINDVITLAFRLLAHETIAPGSVDARNVAEQIATSLQGKDLFWMDSETGGFTLMALAVFAKHNPASEGKAVLTNNAGGELLHFKGEAPVSWSGTETEPLTLKTEDGSVWYSWTSSGVPVENAKPFAKGIEITTRLLHADGTPLSHEPIQFGQMVKLEVTATIRTPQPMVRLSILLPGGLEAQDAGKAPDKQSGTIVTDKRLDRVILNALNAGKSVTWTVPCRAVFRGTFNVPSVAIDVPANPGMGALGETKSLTIR